MRKREKKVNNGGKLSQTTLIIGRKKRKRDAAAGHADPPTPTQGPPRHRLVTMPLTAVVVRGATTHAATRVMSLPCSRAPDSDI